jgi:hypothetical protein
MQGISRLAENLLASQEGLLHRVRFSDTDLRLTGVHRGSGASYT